MIQNEKFYNNMDRLMARKNITEDEEVMAFMESFTNTKMDEIVVPDLTDEERAEDLAIDALVAMADGELTPDNFMDYVDMVERVYEKAPNNKYTIEAAYSYEEDKSKKARLLKKAIKLGEEMFGGDYEKEMMGKFYQAHVTRSYMRMRQHEILDHFKEGNYKVCCASLERQLQLNENDNQGLRNLLSSMYLYFKEYDKFMDLMDQFVDENDNTQWLFNYALYLYMLEGDCEDSNDAMEEALLSNPFVLPYLTAKKKIKDMPGYYSHGTEEEAIIYIYESLFAWRNVFGVQSWLKKF